MSQATDRDLGTHGVVWYELTTGGNPFVIGRTNGELTTAAVFRGLEGFRYSLNVRAFDNEGMQPTLTNETTIMVCRKGGREEEEEGIDVVISLCVFTGVGIQCATTSNHIHGQ